MKKLIILVFVIVMLFTANKVFAENNAGAIANADAKANVTQDDHSSTLINEIQKRPLVNPYAAPQFVLTPYNGAQKGKWFLYWSPVDQEFSLEAIDMMKKRYTFPEIITGKWLKRHVRSAVREKPLPDNSAPIKLLSWDPFTRGFNTNDRKIGEVVFKNRYSFGPWPFDAFMGLVLDEAKQATMTRRVFVFVRLNDKAVAKASALALTGAAASVLRSGTQADNSSAGGAITPMLGSTSLEIEEVEEIRVLCMNDGLIEPPTLPEKKAEKSIVKPEVTVPPAKQEVEVKVIVVGPPQEIKVPAETKETAPQKRCELPEITVYFDFDKSDIRAQEAPRVAMIAYWLKANPQCKVQVEGHACKIGTDDYNASLGRRRAKAVYDLLIEKGISPSQICQFVSVSEDKPADFEKLEKNRRVIVRTIGPASGK